jgi:RNA ligase (TIGR02306 family)
MTVYRHNGVFGVCSRNLDLAETDDNAFWKTARNLDIENKLKDLCLDNIAIQGELMGPGVQGNHEGLTELDFFVFDIFNIASQEYLSPAARQIVTHSLKLNHAPIIGNAEFKFENIDQALEFAEGPSLKNPKREGVVFKSDTNPNFSFKIIANSYLLAHADR